MKRKKNSCTICANPDLAKINEALLSGAALNTLAGTYGVNRASLYRHRKHIPAKLAKAHEAKEIATADNLMGRMAALDAKAQDVYARALKAHNLTAAIAAVRELREITTLYAKISGELQSQNVTNIIISPEWVNLRNVIIIALEPYPEARRAVIEAVGRCAP